MPQSMRRRGGIVSSNPLVNPFASAGSAQVDDVNAEIRSLIADATAKISARERRIDQIETELDNVNMALAVLRANGPAGGAPAASTTPQQREYRSAFSGSGGYLRRGIETGLRDLAVQAALSSDSGADGGYTVTPELDTMISRVQQTVCAMRGISQVVQISSSSYGKLVSQGGAIAGWTGERDSRPSTNSPTLSLLHFPAMELYALPGATQTLLDDSAVNIEQWLADEVGVTFAEQEGAAFVTGDGVNKPMGFLSYPIVANASYAWGKIGYVATTDANGFQASSPGDNLVDLFYSLKQSYRSNGTWLMNSKTAGVIRKMKDGEGRYIWQQPLQAGEPALLLGSPVEMDENMADIGPNAYPVAFGDFRRGYLIVDRIGVRILRDPYTSKPNVLFYTTKRVGGGVQNFEAIKLLKCASS